MTDASALQRAFRKKKQLSCRPTFPLACAVKVKKKEEGKAAPPPLTDWLKQALGGGLEVVVGRGLLSMLSEEECHVMATQRALPSADAVRALPPSHPPPPSHTNPPQALFLYSLVSSQINLLRNEHKVSGSDAQIHTFFVSVSDTALHCSTDHRFYSCMQKKKKMETQRLKLKQAMYYSENQSPTAASALIPAARNAE